MQYVNRGGCSRGRDAPDAVTFEYLPGRDFVPKDFEKAVQEWQKLPLMKGQITTEEIFESADVVPQVTWGTNPAQVVGVDAAVPNVNVLDDPNERTSGERALEYMGLSSGTKITDIPLERVFIGSCTNSRIEDLRAAADVIRGYHVSGDVHAMVVPGSGCVKRQAEEEGLDRIFTDAGFEWREAGCSMCLGMNPDTPPVNDVPQRAIGISRAGKEGWAYTSRFTGYGCRRCGGRTFCGYPRMEISIKHWLLPVL